MKTKSPQHRVLILGLETGEVQQLRKLLKTEGWTSRSTSFFNSNQGLEAVSQLEADLVFFTGESDGSLDFLLAMKQQLPAIPVVFVTPDSSSSYLLDVLDTGVMDYCSSPFEAGHIRWILERAVQQAA